MIPLWHRGGIKENISLLEKIIRIQRKIITGETKKDATEVPQLLSLYKEVQDYYNAGMLVPDDITLLWAEDNWGNIRRLPTSDETKRSGGAGIYYHFDYHGGPRSYQWINTSSIAKIWDQMSLAKKYGADRVWIVNVGHLKGYELPIEYFLSLGWNTDIWTNENINEFTELWIKREFGEKYSKEIANMVSKYIKYNGRIKPELLSPITYSLINYNEFENVVNEYSSILKNAEYIYTKLPKEKLDAFYQLVLFPIKACAIVNELYYSAGKNDLYFKQGRASTNNMSKKTRDLFKKDIELMNYYNNVFAGGKWKHFMDQPHLGYVTWKGPFENNLQAINLKELEIPEKAFMGIAVEENENSFDDGEESIIKFDIFNKQTRYIDIFNKGRGAFNFTIDSNNPWIIISETKGIITEDKRIFVTIDWNKVQKGSSEGEIKISGTNNTVKIKLDVFNPKEITPDSLKGFIESDGVVSILAEHYSNIKNSGNKNWIKIEDYGYELSGMRADSPPYINNLIPGKDAPCLEYNAYFFSKGKFDIHLVFGTTLNFMPDRGLSYALSIDNDEPKIITLVPKDYNAQNGNRDWEKSVILNYRISTSSINISSTGYHAIKIWMVNPGPVLQKIIVDLGGLKSSFMGPPESFHK